MSSPCAVDLGVLTSCFHAVPLGKAWLSKYLLHPCCGGTYLNVRQKEINNLMKRLGTKTKIVVGICEKLLLFFEDPVLRAGI